MESDELKELRRDGIFGIGPLGFLVPAEIADAPKLAPIIGHVAAHEIHLHKLREELLHVHRIAGEYLEAQAGGLPLEHTLIIGLRAKAKEEEPCPKADLNKCLIREQVRMD